MAELEAAVISRLKSTILIYLIESIVYVIKKFSPDDRETFINFYFSGLFRPADPGAYADFPAASIRQQSWYRHEKYRPDRFW